MKKWFSFVLLAQVIISTVSYAQTGVDVKNLPPFEAEKYLKPLSTYFGTYFNTGTYYTADVAETFGFKFSIIGMWTIIPEKQKTFQPDPQLTGVETPDPSATIFGNKASYFLSNNGFFVYPTGLSLNSVPFVIYQASGALFGTELMLRFFPKTKFGDAKVGLFGFGLKHNIDRYIPLLPVDISVQLLYNTFNFEYVGNDLENYTVLKSKNFAINAEVSKTLVTVLTVYGGVQYESSTMDFDYYFKDPNNLYPAAISKRNNSLKIDGDNHFRFTVGSSVKLGFFVFNLDMNLTSFTTFSSGISFDF